MGTVYVCDDDRAMRMLVELWLEDEPGIAVVGSGGGQRECLEAIAAAPPWAVLLDHGLPGVVCADLVAEIRRRAPGTLVILHSGLDEQALAREAELAGADAYLSKRDGAWLCSGLRRLARGAAVVG